MGRIQQNKNNEVGSAQSGDTLLLTTPKGEQVFISASNFFKSSEIDTLSKAETINKGLVLE